MPDIVETTDAPGDATTPYVLAPGDTFSGTLATSSDVDLVALEVTAGMAYQISLPPDGAPNPMFGIATSLSGAISYSTSIGSSSSSTGSNTVVTFVASQTGTVFFGVNPFDIPESEPYAFAFEGIGLGQGNSENNILVGGEGPDLLRGFAGDDRLDGGTGNDIMDGGLGNDRYIVDSAGDRITGETGFSLGGGIDTVESWISYNLTPNLEILRLQGTADLNGTGGFAPEALVGNVGNNLLDGGGGNDVLNGKSGDDTLVGGLGADTLVGEAGADVFDFNAINQSRPGQASRDFINGFVHGEDLIDLSDIDANSLTDANDAFDFIGSDAFSGTAGELRFFTFSGGNFNIVEADVDGDGVADMQIFVNLTNTMFEGDFVL